MMIKEALRLWEEKTGKKAAESAEVKLNGMFPSIEKMDSALNQLVCCQSEVVADTLEELWISYNNIERMKGINALRKLAVLYMSNNFVKDWSEFTKLNELPNLVDLVFVGNPLEERYAAEGTWREEAIKRLPSIKRLDGAPVIMH
ncbi:Dynein light chain 1, axonemal [Amphibalanus amphitrite]|uniref:Dynein axonemal light chain 1 n=1 Tax=Amphibalanus amphitrite TaxID=1232801 RepID=A0A6A4VVI1_AMPAM|nr:Dynein light chain 1, axonemal [Amphibalanus amphitrite]